ncbi:hypothetical protein AAMO2058_000729900 [Amorphochlora amoebiformis]
MRNPDTSGTPEATPSYSASIDSFCIPITQVEHCTSGDEKSTSESFRSQQRVSIEDRSVDDILVPESPSPAKSFLSSKLASEKSIRFVEASVQTFPTSSAEKELTKVKPGTPDYHLALPETSRGTRSKFNGTPIVHENLMASHISWDTQKTTQEISQRRIIPAADSGISIEAFSLKVEAAMRKVHENAERMKENTQPRWTRVPLAETHGGSFGPTQMLNSPLDATLNETQVLKSIPLYSETVVSKTQVRERAQVLKSPPYTTLAETQAEPQHFEVESLVETQPRDNEEMLPTQIPESPGSENFQAKTQPLETSFAPTEPLSPVPVTQEEVTSPTHALFTAPISGVKADDPTLSSHRAKNKKCVAIRDIQAGSRACLSRIDAIKRKAAACTIQVASCSWISTQSVISSYFARRSARKQAPRPVQQDPHSPLRKFAKDSVVWARQDGFPRWPATVVDYQGDTPEVKFLGAISKNAQEESTALLRESKISKFDEYTRIPNISQRRVEWLKEEGWDLEVAFIEAKRKKQAGKRAMKRKREAKPAARNDDSRRKSLRRKSKVRDLFRNVSFLLTGFKNCEDESRQLTKEIQSLGGKVIDRIIDLGMDLDDSRDADEVELDQRRLRVCLAHHPNTTKKSLYSLARGLLPLSPSWVKACISENDIVDAKRFTVSVQGCSRQLKKSVSERMGLLPLPIADRILNGVHIKLVGMEDFIETFAVLLEESGASICRKLSRK